MANEIHRGGKPEGKGHALRNYFPAPSVALTAAYCAFIFFLSSLPMLPVKPPFPMFDKLVHFGLYGGLGAVVAIGMWWADREYSAGARVVVPTAFCFFYGLSDETHQLFVANRSFDLADVAADVAGAAVAAILLAHVWRRRNSKT